MSSLFDKYKKNPKHIYVKAYLHFDYSREIINDLSSNMEILTNKATKNFEQVISFLSDSEIILTNSFHGMYWATLLGKKVIVFPWVDKNGYIGFSEKFRTFQYSPVFVKIGSRMLQNYMNIQMLCMNVEKRIF